MRSLGSREHIASIVSPLTILSFMKEFQFTDIWLIESLDNVAVRIGKIERITAISMLCWRSEHLTAQWINLGNNGAVHPLDMMWAIENHADVIEQLPLAWLVSRNFISWDLMERKIVDPRAEIHVILIRFPYRLHPEELFVESAREWEIGDTKGQMPKPSMQWSSHGCFAPISSETQT